MNDDMKDLAATDGGRIEALARASVERAGSPNPRAIVDYVFAHPFSTEIQLNVEDVVMKNDAKGRPTEVQLPAGVGTINKVTPEQLVAIVASILTTSPDAVTCCQRLRTEITGWKFAGADGERY